MTGVRVHLGWSWRLAPRYGLKGNGGWVSTKIGADAEGEAV
jgi:hypothetical protein